MEVEYRFARSSEQLRVEEELRDLYSTAGVLVVDAQGHGVISAKIASTVHDTFHALMLTELDRYGRTTPMLLDNLNLRLAQSVTARNALGITEKEEAREIAGALYISASCFMAFIFSSSTPQPIATTIRPLQPVQPGARREESEHVCTYKIGADHQN